MREPKNYSQQKTKTIYSVKCIKILFKIIIIFFIKYAPPSLMSYYDNISRILLKSYDVHDVVSHSNLNYKIRIIFFMLLCTFVRCDLFLECT